MQSLPCHPVMHIDIIIDVSNGIYRHGCMHILEQGTLRLRHLDAKSSHSCSTDPSMDGGFPMSLCDPTLEQS
jgi:hypothetical protein